MSQNQKTEQLLASQNAVNRLFLSRLIREQQGPFTVEDIEKLYFDKMKTRIVDGRDTVSSFISDFQEFRVIEFVCGRYHVVREPKKIITPPPLCCRL